MHLAHRYGSGSDLDSMGTSSGSTMDEKFDALLSKFVHIETKIAQISDLTAWMSWMDSHISETLGDFATRLTGMEQNFSALTPHVCASSRHMQLQHQMYPVRQGPGLRLSKLTAPQSLGPMAQDHLMTTETHGEGLILLQAQKMNKSVVPFYYDLCANNTSKELPSGSIPFLDESSMQAFHKPVRNHCKAVSVSVRLVSETRAKSQHFVVREKDDGFSDAIDSPFCCTKTNIIVRQSKSIEDRRIRKTIFRRCVEKRLTSSKFSSLMEMTKVHSSSLRWTLARKSSASKIAETELENRCKHLLLLHLTCVFLVFLVKCCNHRFFRRLAGRGALFRGFPFRWDLHFVSI